MTPSQHHDVRLCVAAAEHYGTDMALKKPLIKRTAIEYCLSNPTTAADDAEVSVSPCTKGSHLGTQICKDDLAFVESCADSFSGQAQRSLTYLLQLSPCQKIVHNNTKVS